MRNPTAARNNIGKIDDGWIISLNRIIATPVGMDGKRTGRKTLAYISFPPTPIVRMA